MAQYDQREGEERAADGDDEGQCKEDDLPGATPGSSSRFWEIHPRYGRTQKKRLTQRMGPSICPQSWTRSSVTAMRLARECCTMAESCKDIGTNATKTATASSSLQPTTSTREMLQAGAGGGAGTQLVHMWNGVQELACAGGHERVGLVRSRPHLGDHMEYLPEDEAGHLCAHAPAHMA